MDLGFKSFSVFRIQSFGLLERFCEGFGCRVSIRVQDAVRVSGSGLRYTLVGP